MCCGLYLANITPLRGDKTNPVLPHALTIDHVFHLAVHLSKGLCVPRCSGCILLDWGDFMSCPCWPWVKYCSISCHLTTIPCIKKYSKREALGMPFSSSIAWCLVWLLMTWNYHDIVASRWRVAADRTPGSMALSAATAGTRPTRPASPSTPRLFRYVHSCCNILSARGGDSEAAAHQGRDRGLSHGRSRNSYSCYYTMPTTELYIYTYIYIYLYMCIYMYINIYICMYVNI